MLGTTHSALLRKVCQIRLVNIILIADHSKSLFEFLFIQLNPFCVEVAGTVINAIIHSCELPQLCNSQLFVLLARGHMNTRREALHVLAVTMATSQCSKLTIISELSEQQTCSFQSDLKSQTYVSGENIELLLKIMCLKATISTGCDSKRKAKYQSDRASFQISEERQGNNSNISKMESCRVV